MHRSYNRNCEKYKNGKKCFEQAGELGRDKSLTISLVLVSQSMLQLAPAVAYFLRVEVPVNSSVELKKYHLNA